MVVLASVAAATVCVLMLVCPIQCPNENDQMEKRFYIDADIPKWYSFLFRTLFNWYFLRLVFTHFHCVWVSCYFYASEILDSLLAVDFIGINATNENHHKCTNWIHNTKRCLNNFAFFSSSSPTLTHSPFFLFLSHSVKNFFLVFS